MLQAWLATGIYLLVKGYDDLSTPCLCQTQARKACKSHFFETFFCCCLHACQPVQQAFPFGFGAKKDRGTGFSVLAAREMKQEPKNESGGRGSFTYAIFRAVFDSRSSFFAPKPHGNACYAGYTRADKFSLGQILFLDGLFRDGPLEKSACTNFCFRSLLVQEFFFR